MSTTAETPTYRKVSSKQYQVIVDGKYIDVFVPFAKAELIFRTMLSNGVSISEEGKVVVDPIAFISSITPSVNVLLTQFDEKGQVKEEGHCEGLSMEEVKELFNLATEVVENFTQLLTSAEPKENSEGSREKPAKKTK